MPANAASAVCSSLSTRVAFHGCTAAGSSTRVQVNVRGTTSSSRAASNGAMPSVTRNVEPDSSMPAGGGSGPSGTLSSFPRPTTRTRTS